MWTVFFRWYQWLTLCLLTPECSLVLDKIKCNIIKLLLPENSVSVRTSRQDTWERSVMTHTLVLTSDFRALLCFVVLLVDIHFVLFLHQDLASMSLLQTWAQERGKCPGSLTPMPTQLHTLWVLRHTEPICLIWRPFGTSLRTVQIKKKKKNQGMTHM